ncbi:hypothetical protein EHO61_08840 [Leptospira fluminis]|uniref:Uncharacterized protein n=1 Tax=Leptospira fluminis TaxID=2484979 RepID=A0A4R9GPN5_9LEPT|nr:hypothetical protein [Leptospira fluminis]TGK18998.1 hypothetical protein EHO61_08840 [Leptospira fluminis]
MNPLYVKAMYGKLPSVPKGNPVTVTVKNNLTVDVMGFKLDQYGMRDILFFPPFWIQAGTSFEFSPQKPRISQWVLHPGDALLFTEMVTGAFISAAVVSDEVNQTIQLTQSVLCDPNDIGPFPRPNPEIGIIVPTNGPRVVVGLNAGGKLVRSQYWQRSADSITLKPGMKRTIEHTVRSGKTQTSSTQDTFEAAVNLSANVGWGVVSASASADLSYSSLKSSSFTISQRSTYTVVDIFENIFNEPMTIFVWQLIDELVSIDWSKDKGYFVKGTVSNVLTPAIVCTVGPKKEIKIGYTAGKMVRVEKG